MQQSTGGAATYSYSQGAAWASPAAAKPRGVTGLLPAGPSCQPCPECGGLECLCRPRFFAGQLLSEQDLNRLEDYILAKNRLHNRYLVGRGVVCGLQVACGPCGANDVTVSSGYAIDTCGNDIIVCSTDTVDICSLINACTPATGPNCAPYKDTTFCKDATQEWILAIRYQESPSRGVTPLTGASKCSCGATGGGSCSCGGTSRCGCGSGRPAASCCGTTMTPAPAVSTMRPRRGAPASCEPTLTCEGYCYEVFPAPPEPARTTTPVRGIAGLASTIPGELFARFSCCVQELIALVPPLPAQTAGQVVWSNFCCNLRAALIGYVSRVGGTDCALTGRLRAVICPGPNSQVFSSELTTAIEEMGVVLFELFVQCFCSAAQPPCPEPGDPRVPLASVTVRIGDCGIVSVCDWTPLRKHVVTNRTLGYWLGWLPIVPMIRDFMRELCCGLFGLRDQFPVNRDIAGATVEARTVNTAGAAAEEEQGVEFKQPISFSRQAYYASNPISEAVTANLQGGPQSVNIGELIRALLDPIDPGSAGANDPARALATMPHAKILAEIARPLMASFGPLANAATGGLSGTKLAAASSDVEALRAELDTLKTTVARQQAVLDAMPPPAGSTPPPQNPTPG